MKIDFDSALVQITDIEGLHLVARVLKGGAVGSNKGIGIDRTIKLPAFTNKDVKAFEIAQHLALDTVFLSFCSSGEDVLNLRSHFKYKIDIISKIESRVSIANLESICTQSEAVLIDRGDLSRDVPLTKFHSRKRIYWIQRSGLIPRFMLAICSKQWCKKRSQHD